MRREIVMSRKFVALVFAAIAVLAPVTGTAQVATGIISGLVHDSSGAAVPGATVRVLNETTNVATETVSDEQGAFKSTPLSPGSYQVATVLDGFEAPVSLLQLRAGETVTVNVTLTPSRFSEAVVVTARRVEEVAQEVPIPVTVVGGAL